MSASGACRARIAPSPPTGGGVGLFATAPIPSGALILSIEQPLLAIPDIAYLEQTCSNCLCWVPEPGATGYSVQQWLNSGYAEEPKSLKTCTGCKVVRYCDKVGGSEGCMPVLRARASPYSLFSTLPLVVSLWSRDCVLKAIITQSRTASQPVQ
jgi:hypothetical protein